jgi:hypothetical protein
MTRAISLVLALTLSSAPLANIACVEGCDERAGDIGGSSDRCHSDTVQGLFAAIESFDVCEAFASTPFVREDVRRVAPAAVSSDVGLRPAILTPVGHRAKNTSAGTRRLRPNDAQVLVLRV